MHARRSAEPSRTALQALFLQVFCVLGSLVEALVARVCAPRPSAPDTPPTERGNTAPGNKKSFSLDTSFTQEVPAPAPAPTAAPGPAPSWFEALRERSLTVRYSFLALGACISLSSCLANGSLAYVSQPVKVLFKSSKILPVIFFRAILGNASANSWADYGYGLALAVGLALFSFSDVAGSVGSRAEATEQLKGCLMLVASVCLDAVAPNLQERLLRRFAQPRSAVVFNTNALSGVLTAGLWLPSGEAVASVRYLSANTHALKALLLQSLAGYLGIVAYLGCIKHAGSKATVLVTTARKLFTIALSYSVFSGSAFTGRHALGLAVAVWGMTGSALREGKNGGSSTKGTTSAPPGGKEAAILPPPSEEDAGSGRTQPGLLGRLARGMGGSASALAAPLMRGHASGEGLAERNSRGEP